MEVLITVALFSIIMMTLFSSFQAFVSSSSRITGVIKKTDRLKPVFRRIMMDTRSICVIQPPQYLRPDLKDDSDVHRLILTEETHGSMRFSSVEFSTFSTVRLSGESIPGPVRVRYYVNRNKDGGFDLHRSQRQILSPEKEIPADRPCMDPVLVKNITRFDMAGLASGSDTDGEKQSEWDSDSKDTDYAFPAALEIILTMAEENDTTPVEKAVETLIPIPVQRTVSSDQGASQ